MQYLINKYLGDSDRAIRHYLAFRFKDFHLEGNRFIFFATVARYPGVSQADICRITLFDKAIVARGVAKLEELHYIQRQHYEGDRKTAHLFLTPHGEQIFQQMETIIEELNLRISQEAGMPPKQLEALIKRISAATKDMLNETCGTDYILDI